MTEITIKIASELIYQNCTLDWRCPDPTFTNIFDLQSTNSILEEQGDSAVVKVISTPGKARCCITCTIISMCGHTCAMLEFLLSSYLLWQDSREISCLICCPPPKRVCADWRSRTCPVPGTRRYPPGESWSEAPGVPSAP